MTNFSHNTQPQHTPYNFQKTPTPWSPPSGGFQRLQFYRWVRSLYVARSISITATRRCNFLCETNYFFILLTIILCAAGRRARRQKVWFFSEYLWFLFGCYVKSTRTDPSYPPIYFSLMPPEASSCFSMISDEGVERHCPGCRWPPGGCGKYLGGTIHRYSMGYLLDKLILREKT